jgi:hypothetical protein
MAVLAMFMSMIVAHASNLRSYQGMLESCGLKPGQNSGKELSKSNYCRLSSLQDINVQIFS